MTQDEIIEMARQIQKNCGVSEDGYRIWSYEALGSFAKLVAAKALAQRTWAGLTDDEVFEICNSSYNRDSELVKMVEAELKQKNGYAEEKNT